MTAIVPARRFGDQDFQVELTAVLPENPGKFDDPERQKLAEELGALNVRIHACDAEIRKLDAEIDRLTSHADGLDYAVAVASGILSGLIDSFFVGKTNTDVEDIRKELEKKYHTANDSAFKHKTKNGTEGQVSSPHLHRLEDLAHHPTLVGLLAAIAVRFFRLCVFSDGEGKTRIFINDKNQNPEKHQKEMKDMCVAWSLAALSGILIWLGSVAKRKYKEEVGEDVPVPLKKMINAIAATPAVIELMLTADTWIGHIMSDVSTPRGVPGVFLSVLKEISMLPGLNKTGLPGYVQRLYKGQSMNMSKYAGVAFAAAKKQSLPVIINEVLVRGFFFVRRLVSEYQEHRNFRDINWEKVIPFNNRTVARMMTISSATFTVVDMADSAIRGVANSGGTAVGFAKEFVLHVNFVGVGRFAIALVTDVGMGIKREKLRNERMGLYSEMLALTNAKVFYQEAGMWMSAADTGKTLAMTMAAAENSIVQFRKNWSQIENDMDDMHADLGRLADRNPDLANDILDILTMG